jgi:hypothetical protein
MNSMPNGVKAFLTALSWSLLIACFAGCAGSPGIPPEKQQYIEGRIIEGGALGFRIIDDENREFLISAGGDAVYNPPDFHALYGDRLGVTYGVVTRGSGERNAAVRVDLLQRNPNRLEIESPSVGIIREAGMTRHKIHLIPYGLTAILLYDRNIVYQPEGWKPTDGNRVKVFITTVPGRFMEKRFFNRIELLEAGPLDIQDEIIRGTVREVQRDRLSLWTSTGKAAIVYIGSETTYSPEDLEPTSGDRVAIEFYRKLMGDRSIRLTATRIEKASL